MEPDTSGQMNTWPGTAGTFSVATSIATCNASRTAPGTDSSADVNAMSN